MVNDKCPVCGKFYASGEVHRCLAEDVTPLTKPVVLKSYRDRDADKRRTYMREYMRRWRARKAVAKAL
jgi:hypothetical protein